MAIRLLGAVPGFAGLSRTGRPGHLDCESASNSDPQRHQRKSLTRNLFRGKRWGRRLDSTKTANSETAPNASTMNGGVKVRRRFTIGDDGIEWCAFHHFTIKPRHLFAGVRRAGNPSNQSL
jgi:hypothetical protein